MMLLIITIIVCFLMLQYCSFIHSLHYGCPTDPEVIKRLQPCVCSQPFVSLVDF